MTGCPFKKQVVILIVSWWSKISDKKLRPEIGLHLSSGRKGAEVMVDGYLERNSTVKKLLLRNSERKCGNGNVWQSHVK